MKFIYDLQKAVEQEKRGEITPKDYARIYTILKQNEAKIVPASANLYVYESAHFIPDLRDYHASTESGPEDEPRHAGAFEQPESGEMVVDRQLQHWRTVIVPQLEAAAGMKPGDWDSGKNNTEACLLCWVAYQLGRRNRMIVDMSGKDVAEVFINGGII